MSQPQSPRVRILVVEDDPRLAALVSEYLTVNGFQVETESRGDRAVRRIVGENPQLVILDIMLPGLDGLTVCREVRPAYGGAILMLTARGDEVDEVVGLEVGADDYMAKPVRPRLLLARINTLLRRSGTTDDRASGARKVARSERLVLGRLLVDGKARAAEIDGERLELTSGEYDLLYLLAKNAGEILSRDQIYRVLRGIEWDGLDRSIDLRVARLRRKLGDDAKHPMIIKSVRGAGYLMVTDP